MFRVVLFYMTSKKLDGLILQNFVWSYITIYLHYVYKCNFAFVQLTFPTLITYLFFEMRVVNKGNKYYG